jgi:hypothetical protein
VYALKSRLVLKLVALASVITSLYLVADTCLTLNLFYLEGSTVPETEAMIQRHRRLFYEVQNSNRKRMVLVSVCSVIAGASITWLWVGRRRDDSQKS